MSKKILALVAAGAITLLSATAFASVTLTNKDAKSYKLLIASSDSCFSGTHTSIGSNTTTSVGSGYICINEEKPAYKVEDGKSYVIKDGKVEPK